MSDEKPQEGERRRRRNRRSGRKRTNSRGQGNQPASEQTASADGPNGVGNRDQDRASDSQAADQSSRNGSGNGAPHKMPAGDKSAKGQRGRGPGKPGKRSRNGRSQHRNGEAEGRYRHTFGVIDLGTNNCRLLVAKPVQSGGFRVVDAYSRIVRLGEGVGQTGALSDAAMTRAVDALALCARKMKRRGVTRSWAIATQACRLADNGQEFCDTVKQRTGIDLDIIEPEREARLAVAGCMPLIQPDVDRALVFDIGGGSTELIWLDVTGARPKIIDWTSLEVGVVTLTEEHAGSGENGLGHVDVSKASYDAMIAQVEGCMADFAEKYATDNAAGESLKVQVLGTSGTVTTLAGVYLGLPRYDRSKVDGIWMPRQEILDISARLSVMPYEERIKQPCIGKERGDLVIAGCAILEAICTAWPTEQVRVADRGLREGMLIELMTAADDAAKAEAGKSDGAKNKHDKPRRRRRGGRNRRRGRGNNDGPTANQSTGESQ